MTTAQQSPRAVNAPDAVADRLRAELAATQELVRLIAGDADLQAVLEAVTVLTGRLIGTGRAIVSLLDGDRLAYRAGIPLIDGRLWLQSAAGGVLRRRPLDPAPGEDWVPVPDAQQVPSFRAMVRGVPLDPGSVPARAVLERRTIAVADLFGPEGDAFPTTREVVGSSKQVGAGGYASLVATPLLRGGHPVGALTAMSTDPHRFTADEVALLETFAAQVAVAVENARLLADLQERLEEQTATGRVLEVISRSPTDLQTVLDTIAESASRLCESDRASIALLRADELHVVAAFGSSASPPSLLEPSAIRSLNRTDSTHGRAVIDRAVVRIADLRAVPVEDLAVLVLRRAGVRSVLTVPLLRGGTAIGAISLHRMEVNPFTERQVALIQTFADQAVIAIENARLFSELQTSNGTLTEALEQQTATADILRVISRSPNDVNPVLEAIVRSAGHLSGASRALVYLREGDRLRARALYTSDGQIRLAGDAPSGQPSSSAHALAQAQPLNPQWAAARAVIEARTIYLPDILAVPDGEYTVSVRIARDDGLGNRSLLLVPLLREGRAIGVIAVLSREVGAFSDKEIALYETFADQAVIAIENARLFTELNESNATLKEALDQQTATAEVLQTISRSAFDLQAVLQTLIDSAVRLCAADGGLIWRISGDSFQRLVASPPEPGEHMFSGTLDQERRSGSIFGRVADQRCVIHWEDVQADDTLNAGTQRAVRHYGARGFMSVPMFRDGELVGVLDLARQTVGAFTPRQEALARTFADQAVIAVENARLLSELRERDERRRQELDRASTIQQRLLPSAVPGWPGVLEVAVRFRPAVETSGDFYDVLPLAPSRTGDLSPLQIAVGDVAGKGMSAALVTALARAALRSTAAVPTQLATPANTLRLAGARLHEDVGAGNFVACALAVVEPPGRHNAGPLLRLANAAQVPLLLVRDGRSQEIEPPGYRLPLGAEDDGAYEDSKVELRAGDVVLFSSDGLVEAPALPGAAVGAHVAPPAAGRDLFGFSRLAASAAHWAARVGTAEDVAQGIWSDLTAWCGDQSHHDDMTLLVLRVPRVPHAGPIRSSRITPTFPASPLA